MTNALNTEARTIEASPATSKPEAGGQQGRQAVRVIMRDLLRLMRIWWEHTLLLWKALSSFALSLSALIVVIVVTTLLTRGLIRKPVAIEPISVPKELADKGYVPEVAARRLRDAVHTFVAKSE